MKDIPINTEVLIVKDCRPNAPSNATGMKGTLEGYDNIFNLINDDGSIEKADTPRIRLSNGDLIYGFQCWWEVKDDAGNLFWSLDLA